MLLRLRRLVYRLVWSLLISTFVVGVSIWMVAAYDRPRAPVDGFVVPYDTSRFGIRYVSQFEDAVLGLWPGIWLVLFVAGFILKSTYKSQLRYDPIAGKAATKMFDEGSDLDRLWPWVTALIATFMVVWWAVS